MFPARVCGFCGFAENSRQPFVSGGSLAFGVCGFLRRVAEKSRARSYPQFSANLPQALRPVVVGFPQFPQNPQGVAFGSVKTASGGNILRLSKRFCLSEGGLRNNRSGFYETFVKAIAPVVGPGWRGRFSMGFSGVYPWSLSSACRSAFGIGTRHFRSFRPLAVRYTGAQLRSFLGISTNTLPGSRITLQRSSSGVPYLPLQLCSLMAWLISSISGIILTSPPLTGVFSDSSRGCVK